jgi:hypothetical protein
MRLDSKKALFESGSSPLKWIQTPKHYSRSRLRREAKDAIKAKTHDCALDLAPLALPPDFPPVILIDLVVVVGFEVLKVS